MGVTGLWQIVEPAGRPVNVQSLRGKVLAVDVSIWLHQLVKGFRDKDGNPLPNAHLLGVFHRVCKLLHYGIKPVFVFDGGVPELKRQTMMARRKRKLQAQDKSEDSRQKLLSNYLRQQIQRQTMQALPPTLRMESQIQALSSPTKSKSVSPTKKAGPAVVASSSKGDVLDTELQSFREKFASRAADDKDDDGLIEGEEDYREESDSEDSDEHVYGMDYSDNFSAIVSSDFDALPLETQHEVLFEMQESRKMNSWGKIDKMPQNLQDFSSYQMDRLVKRRFLQKKIQSVQQEMGQRHIHVQNLDDLLKMDYSFDGKSEIIGSQDKGCVLVKTSPKKKVEDPKPGSSSKKIPEVITIDDYVGDGWSSSESDSDEKVKLKIDATLKNDSLKDKSNPEIEEDEQLALAIQMSLMENTKIESDINEGVCDDPSTNEIKRNAKSVDPSPSKELESPAVMKALQFSQLSSCSKFLDTVGFASKVNTVSLSTPKNVSKENETSDSDDDFEAVEDQDLECSMQDPDSEKNLVKKLLLATNPDNEIPVHSTVATIKLDEVVKTQPEDDIFADIFSNKDENVEIPIDTHLNLETANSTTEEVQEVDDIKWDSDPDLDDLEETEQSFASSESKNEQDERSAEVASNSNKLAHEAFLSKFIRAPESAKPTTTEGSSSNETITRTLGRMPFQGTENKGVKVVTAEYMQAQEKLNSEQDKLNEARGFQERVATSISDQMSVETQELLSIFGIPYIVSPMEAESQCAFLDNACLVDGTITDDSDIWLFNGRRVYKNFYASGGRQLEFYQQADIIKILNLDREKLVLLAMLMGGDYNEGIDGVGPVTALELISEFPTNSIISFDSLVNFREWWEQAQNQKRDAVVESKVKEKLRKLKLSPGFPSRAVYDAYMDPKIDNSTEPFRWGNPDLLAIRAYTKDKFGWDQSKCDGMVLPVLKDLRCQAEQSKQLTMDRFVTFGGLDLDKPYKRKKGSKRLHTAVKKLKRLAPSSNELNLSSDSSAESNSDNESNLNKAEQPPKISLPKKKTTKTKKNNHEDDLSTINPSSSSGVIVRIPKSNPVIPQKVQEETQRNINKQKAIKLLKNKDLKK